MVSNDHLRFLDKTNCRRKTNYGCFSSCLRTNTYIHTCMHTQTHSTHNGCIHVVPSFGGQVTRTPRGSPLRTGSLAHTYKYRYWNLSNYICLVFSIFKAVCLVGFVLFPRHLQGICGGAVLFWKRGKRGKKRHVVIVRDRRGKNTVLCVVASRWTVHNSRFLTKWLDITVLSQQ